jgi:hypothetical protein
MKCKTYPSAMSNNIAIVREFSPPCSREGVFYSESSFFDEDISQEILTGEEVSQILTAKNANVWYGIGKMAKHFFDKTVGKLCRSLSGSSETTTYPLSNCKELQGIRTDISLNYELVNDIDCKDVIPFIPIGNESFPFTGTVNGQNYAISNVHIGHNCPLNTGLFGVTKSAKLHNIRLLHIDINCQNGNTENIGALVGHNSKSRVVNVTASVSISTARHKVDSAGGLLGLNTGYVKNTKVNGKIETLGRYVGASIGYHSGMVEDSCSDTVLQTTGPSQGFHHGSFIGISQLGHIRRCYSEGKFIMGGLDGAGGLIGKAVNSLLEECYSIVNIIGTGWEMRVGGLVGDLINSQISNSYASNSVINSGDGKLHFGGLVRLASRGNIVHSYAVNQPNGGRFLDAGGLVLSADSQSKIVNSYYNDETFPAGGVGKGIAKTSEEMQEKSTFEGWDFEKIWTTDKNSRYPKFHWQKNDVH